MGKWVATASDMHSLGGRDAEAAADPVRAALGQASAVVVLPASDAGEVIVGRVQSLKARQAQELSGGRNVREYEATGLLGTYDRVVYEEPKQKSWWQRLLGKA